MAGRSLLLALALVCGGAAHAQPDSLYVPDGNGITAHAIRYAPLQDSEQYMRTGYYAFDTSRVAVQIDYKRGKPSGIYRAFYPNGKQLIFAVYGWGFLHGDWVEYGPDGRITLKGKYRMGKRQGTWAFREQGIVGKYKKGKKHGRWKYYEHGKLVRKEKWRRGKLMPGHTFLFGN